MNAAVDRPVQFTLEVALAALWESWGIVPNRVVGDGIGEVAASYVAGTLSLEDAARIAAGSSRRPLVSRPPSPSWPARDSTSSSKLDRIRSSLPPSRSASVHAEGSPLILASLRRGDAGLETMRWSAAFLYARGFDLEWSRVSPRWPFRSPAELSLAARTVLARRRGRNGARLSRHGSLIESTTSRPRASSERPVERLPCGPESRDTPLACSDPTSPTVHSRTVTASSPVDVRAETLGLAGRRRAQRLIEYVPRSRGGRLGAGSRQGRSRSAAVDHGARLAERDGV